jgi:hypothetical protein
MGSRFPQLLSPARRLLLGKRRHDCCRSAMAEGGPQILKDLKLIVVMLIVKW